MCIKDFIGYFEKKHPDHTRKFFGCSSLYDQEFVDSLNKIQKEEEKELEILKALKELDAKNERRRNYSQDQKKSEKMSDIGLPIRFQKDITQRKQAVIDSLKDKNPNEQAVLVLATIVVEYIRSADEEKKRVAEMAVDQAWIGASAAVVNHHFLYGYSLCSMPKYPEFELCLMPENQSV